MPNPPVITDIDVIVPYLDRNTRRARMPVGARFPRRWPADATAFDAERFDALRQQSTIRILADQARTAQVRGLSVLSAPVGARFPRRPRDWRRPSGGPAVRPAAA